MLSRLVLENFMAHGRTEIEFGPGLTVLTGPNNAGKSAVVEALRCLVTNPTPKHFIRHGAKEARVTALLDDGTAVTWVRRPKHAIYEVLRPGAAEPEVFAKLGKGNVPPEVAGILRLSPVEVESLDGGVDVHLGNQREPIFLLNKPPSVMAAFFAASSEAAHLLAMQKALAERGKQARRAERDLCARIAAQDQGLLALAALPEAVLGVERVERLHDEARERLAAEPLLERSIQALQGLAARRDAASRRTEKLSRVIEPPALSPVRPLAEWLAAHHGAGERLCAATARQKALAGLFGPPALADAATLANAASGIARLRARQGESRARQAALSPLSPPPTPGETAGLAQTIQALRAVTGGRERLSARVAGLAGLAQPPDLASAMEGAARLRTLLGDVSRRRAEVSAARNALDGTKAALHATAKRVREALARADRCPTCGQTFDPAAFLGEEEGA
ncbi:DNA repair ATPase-like protein [Alkalidesulfovibrio alkalitolerans DSM 16529]|jgi:exonuclease SbcC|uniref:DNA repair protein RecN n=1 Tax=Alkalidesulfovibrio alkalitolerans DSM 16529 TaxID=1121439 RepID=S7TFW0_9BACT|nr:ATP-binding protein [Alkalidesulfovibrio alkalitolerans]EPR35495.1 DNA repair ATPase-like protein [Alkalidesulfovibrio alkalitolerans DSM 16529]